MVTDPQSDTNQGQNQTIKEVRLISNPGRKGFLSGRIKTRGGRTRVEVIFPGNERQYVLESQIEEVTNDEDPFDLLKKGQFGRSADLRRSMTFIRLSGRLANLIYSMQTTHTDFYAYQFKPVLKLLDSPTNGILIADEVGLGKTIEAGLIWTELRSRIDARRLLVLCPAVLREKWRLELRRRFGVNASIANAGELLKELEENRNKGDLESFALISSMQGLRPPKGWEDAPENEREGDTSRLARYLQSQAYEAPLFDLVIIDEAHYLRNPETSTSKLGSMLRNVSEYIVLLSATPIHLKNRDLYELLSLVDEDTFNSPTYFDFLLEANARLVAAREAVMHRELSTSEFKELLEEAKEHSLLKSNRQIQALIDALPSDKELKDKKIRSLLAHRLDNMNVWGHVLTRTRKREVTEWRVLREPVSQKVSLSPVERQFYDAVTDIVRQYCERADLHAGFLYVTPQRQMASSMPAALRGWLGRYRSLEDEAYEDMGDAIGIEDNRVVNGKNVDDKEERPLVKEIIQHVSEFARLDTLWQNDSKYKKLIQVLRTYTRKHPGTKIVLFAYFRPTLDYLSERLSEDGISNIVLKGGQTDEKSVVIDRFRDVSGPRVLLSSEVGSEGIDLQFASLLINYDLPWNPMRVEQRIGRLDRLGQKADKIVIWNLFAEDTIESRIHDRLFLRIGIFNRALGGLEGILGEEIRKLTMDLLSGHITAEEEEVRIEQTAQAIENKNLQERELENQATSLIAYGDYILNEVQAARELNRHINETDLEKYVIDFITQHYPGCRFKQLEANKPIYDVELSNGLKDEFHRFLLNRKLLNLSNLAQVGGRSIRCRFENRVSVSEAGREEVISQFHPLVRFVTQRIKDLKPRHHRVVSLRLSHDSMPNLKKTGLYVFTVQRWILEGMQKQERLHYVAQHIDDEKDLEEENAESLVTIAAQFATDWLEAGNVVDLDRVCALAEDCLTRSDNGFEALLRQRSDENDDRADIQEETLERHRINQMQKLEEIRDRHRLHNRDPLVRATEGRMRALEEKIERRLREIEEGRKMHHSSNDECIGIILIEGN